VLLSDANAEKVWEADEIAVTEDVRLERGVAELAGLSVLDTEGVARTVDEAVKVGFAETVMVAEADTVNVEKAETVMLGVADTVEVAKAEKEMLGEGETDAVEEAVSDGKPEAEIVALGVALALMETAALEDGSSVASGGRTVRVAVADGKTLVVAIEVPVAKPVEDGDGERDSVAGAEAEGDTVCKALGEAGAEGEDNMDCEALSEAGAEDEGVRDCKALREASAVGEGDNERPGLNDAVALGGCDKVGKELSDGFALVDGFAVEPGGRAENEDENDATVVSETLGDLEEDCDGSDDGVAAVVLDAEIDGLEDGVGAAEMKLAVEVRESDEVELALAPVDNVDVAVRVEVEEMDALFVELGVAPVLRVGVDVRVVVEESDRLAVGLEDAP